MAAFPSHSDLAVSAPTPDSAVPGLGSPPAELFRRSKDPWTKRATKKKKKKNLVFLEDGAPEVARTKSLTDEDLDELKGCVDLGFGFSYDEIPELCNTLPALELCYSMSQRFLDEQQKSPEAAGVPPSEPGSSSPSPGPVANWRISGPELDQNCVMLGEACERTICGRTRTLSRIVGCFALETSNWRGFPL